MTVAAASPAADRLQRVLTQRGAACVGLDPVLEKLPRHLRARHTEPLAAIAEFSRGVIDAVKEHAGIIKPQSACYERFGGAGVVVLEQVCRYARAQGLYVILDAKRGDIGISAEHYAAAAVHAGADAITANAYLGPSTIEPYLAAGLAVFALVRTSNPDSDAVQSCRLADGRMVCEMMADHVAAVGGRYVDARGRRSAVGAVVGATKAADGAALRARMPKQAFLVPGYGAQGGTADDVRALMDEERSGVIVNASRSVIFAFGTDDDDARWTAGVARAAEALKADLAKIA